MAKKHKKKITKKLLNKYRMVLLNEETFEERFSLKLSRLNVFVIVGLSAIILIVLTSVLIAFTPLREYIPGYSSTELRKEAVGLVYKTDSLQQIIDRNDKYYLTVQKLLKGETIEDDSETEAEDAADYQENSAEGVDLKPSKADSLLRKQVAQKDKYNVFNPAVSKKKFKLFSPVRGSISSSYEPKKGHYAVDIATSENQPVKAVTDGTIIFAEWTTETGYVIIVDHGNGLISIYKHNSKLLKNQGDQVKAGEVIALTGNTGKYTTGPHLHFELWRNGYPINPEEFIEFE